MTVTWTNGFLVDLKCDWCDAEWRFTETEIETMSSFEKYGCPRCWSKRETRMLSTLVEAFPLGVGSV